MLSRLRNWLQTAPFDDPIERRQAPMLQVMLIGLSIFTGLALLLALSSTNNNVGAQTLTIIGVLLGLVVYPSSLALLRRGRFRLAVALAIVSLLVSITIILIPKGLNSSWLALFALIYPISFAGLLAGRRMLWLTIGLSIVVVCGIGFLGSVAPSAVGYDAPGAIFSTQTVIAIVLVIGFVGLGFDRFGSALHDALVTSLQREQELEQVRAGQETMIGVRTEALREALHEVEQREARLVDTLAELRTSQEVVQELSAPVIPVLPGVLVAPLVGALDSVRAQMLVSNVLAAVEQLHARHVIFDITGVPLVDTHVAQALLQTAAAIQLLGARVFIVGIRPEVAQTMVALNIDLGTVMTYPDLQKAVEGLLQSDGWRRANGQLAAGAAVVPHA
jgi:rsbT co-antagonist protein RsbR